MAIEQTGVRIAELQEVKELTNNDEFIVETPGGTRKINKENLAGEVGGDFSDKMLSDTEELEANTEKGFLADALLVKELYEDLNGLSFGQDDEGNWGYKVGADAVIPFSGKTTILKFYNPTSITGSTGITVNIAKYYPNYKNIKADNIIFADYQGNGILLSTNNGLSTAQLTYNEQTGDVNMRSTNCNFNGYRNYLLIINENKIIDCT